ncbi:MAG: hypothetical protein O2888_00635 [Chloroflexi bacterium]|nr:hypothetical protein [Chloroflexota bacterium]
MELVPIPSQCPRCSALMLVETDSNGTFGSCVTCGYVHDVQRISAVELLAEEQFAAGKQRRRQPSHGSLRL